MPESNPDDLLLLIRCPSCGQRFKVGEDLRGRTVECGACEHRFRINDEVIVRGKKFYPGERRDPALNRFHRVPLAMTPATAPVPAMRYSEPPDPVTFEPASPLRVLAGVVGGLIILLMALLLMFGASRAGALDGMTTPNRLLMAGFAGLLGMTLLVYANPRARMKAGLLGLLLTSGLLALPFFFTVGSVPLESATVQPSVIEEPAALPEEVPADQALSELRNRIGTRPLDEEIARLATEGSKRKAVGLWLRNLRETNRLLLRDYILRTTKADPQSHYYPRDSGDFLMVVTGIDHSLDEVAGILSAIGTVEHIYPEISVVEVRVNNEGFVAGPIDKLTDKAHPAFYELNRRELESIDPDRVAKAVKRLADAEPKIYRSDITRKLIWLMGEPWVDFKQDVSKALAVWSEEPGPAGEAALKEALRLLAAKARMPQEIIALIVKEKNPGVVPVLDELWNGDVTRWESLYGDIGSVAEDTLLKRFPATAGSQRHSAVRILGRVGTPKSVPVLEGATQGADPELRVLIEKSVSAIRQRAGS
jgi:hypothetical protein